MLSFSENVDYVLLQKCTLARSSTLKIIAESIGPFVYSFDKEKNIRLVPIERACRGQTLGQTDRQTDIYHIFIAVVETRSYVVYSYEQQFIYFFVLCVMRVYISKCEISLCSKGLAVIFSERKLKS